MLENTEGTIKNGQSRETDDIGYTKHKTKKNTTQYSLDTTIPKKDTNNVNKTCAFLQITGS